MKIPWVALAGLGVLLALPFGVSRSTQHLVEFNPHSDEGYYLRYASHVAESGPRAIRRIFREYTADREFTRFFPPPTRLLSLGTGAAAVRVLGPGFPSIAWVALAAFLFLLAVMFFCARHWFGDDIAVWAGLLFASAPMHLLLSRRALADTMASAWMLSCLWLTGWAMGLGDGKERPARWWAVAAALACALLVKESALVLVFICLTLLAWRTWTKGRFPGWTAAACVSVIPLGAAAAAALAAAGGWQPLREALAVARLSVESNFARVYLQGPWYRYLVDLMLISPWVLVLFFGWLGLVAAGEVKQEWALFWALVPVIYIAVTLLHPLRDVRYVMPVEMPLRLGAVLLLHRVFGGGRTPKLKGFLSLAVLALAVLDLQSFQRMADDGMIEPINLALLRIDGFLPFLPR